MGHSRNRHKRGRDNHEADGNASSSKKFKAGNVTTKPQNHNTLVSLSTALGDIHWHNRGMYVKYHGEILPDLPAILDPDLLTKVFTHKSALSDSDNIHSDSYERLEWFGDAMVQGIITRLIFERFTFASPGQMSQLREISVKNKALADFSWGYGLHKLVKVRSHPDTLTEVIKPENYMKILGDVFEAYAGAVILSDSAHGHERVAEWFDELFTPVFMAYAPAPPKRGKLELSKHLGGVGVKFRWPQYMQMTMENGYQRHHVSAILASGWGFHEVELAKGSGQSLVEAADAAVEDAIKNSSIVALARARKVEYDRRKAAGASKEELDALKRSWESRH